MSELNQPRDNELGLGPARAGEERMAFGNRPAARPGCVREPGNGWYAELARVVRELREYGLHAFPLHLGRLHEMAGGATGRRAGLPLGGHRDL